MYTVFSIILIILEVTLVVVYAVVSSKKRMVISKGNIFYFIPALVILLFVYMLGFYYVNRSLLIYDVITLIPYCLKAFGFEIKVEYITPLASENVFYMISFFLSYVLIMFTVITTVIGLFKDFFLNKFFVRMKLKKDCDIVIGINEESIDYLKTHNNVIAWIDSYDIESKKIVKDLKVPYVISYFDMAKLNKMPFQYDSFTNYNFIIFSPNKNNLVYVQEFKKFISQKKAHIKYKKENTREILENEQFFIHVELQKINYDSLCVELHKDEKYAAFIDCFNRYELIGKKFILDYPITKYMPKHLMDYSTATISPNAVLNYFFIGFGKISETLFKASKVNDQLVSLTNVEGKIKQHLHQINYYAYDQASEKCENKNMVFFSSRYNREFTQDIDLQEYFPLPEYTSDLNFKNLNINQMEFIKDIKQIIFNSEKEDTYNCIVISFGTDEDNIDMALKLQLYFLQQRVQQYHLFVRVRDSKLYQMEVFTSEKITPFGYFSSVLNHKYIINDELLRLSKSIHNQYNIQRKRDSKWHKLPAVKQACNIYSGLNTRLKLNLLGFDFKNNEKGSNPLIVKKLEEKIKFNKQRYDDYFIYNHDSSIPAQFISIQEHYRWNSFYLNNGFVPMKKSDLKVDDNANMKLFEHACLTTYEGLDEFHKFLAKKTNTSVDEIETYKYDYMALNNFISLFGDKENGYELIELETSKSEG